MNKQRLLAPLAACIVLTAGLFLGYRRFFSSNVSSRDDILSLMPADASAVLFLGLDEFRNSPFLAELYKWAPQTGADADYRQFVHSTGFNYERDLNRVSIAILNRDHETTLFAVAEGRFDQKKISAYALQTGAREKRDGRDLFSVPLEGGVHRMTFAFLRKNRIALTNGSNLESLLALPRPDLDTAALQERFRRLAGSPVFVVIRQDTALGGALSAQAPGGWRSPQLSALIDQLEWITIAGKPEGDRLRLVIEGEGAPDAPTRQLSDAINGLLTLAQAGLSDPKMREQLQPNVREAYLNMLKSADVSQIDRGETKSVRLMFDLTPEFLEAARAANPVVPAAPVNKPMPHKNIVRN